MAISPINVWQTHKDFLFLFLFLFVCSILVTLLRPAAVVKLASYCNSISLSICAGWLKSNSKSRETSQKRKIVFMTSRRGRYRKERSFWRWLLLALPTRSISDSIFRPDGVKRDRNFFFFFFSTHVAPSLQMYILYTQLNLLQRGRSCISRFIYDTFAFNH